MITTLSGVRSDVIQSCFDHQFRAGAADFFGKGGDFIDFVGGAGDVDPGGGSGDVDCHRSDKGDRIFTLFR